MLLSDFVYEVRIDGYAKSMLSDSVPAEQVAKWTSLPLEQVLALKEEMVQA